MRRGFFSFIFICLCFAVILFSRASAEELGIEGNNAGSQNSIVINSGSSFSSFQTNSLKLINKINTEAKTGDNSASQNNGSVQVLTGDATVRVVTDNLGNLNIFDPKNLTPTPLPPIQTPTPTFVLPTGNPAVPTATPYHPKPITSESSPSSGSGESGGIGGAATVIGLSSTAGEPELSDSVTTLLGLVCLALALAHLRGSFSAFV